MAAPAQTSRLGAWVLVGMTLSLSLTGSHPASAQAPRELAHLTTKLHDESPTVRRDAARALGGLGPAAKDAVSELAPLLKDPDAGVRGAAA
jgi:hypothetical protein